MRLITHDGSFHADDVLAYTVLSRIPRFEDAELVRTRDEKLISAAGLQDIVFDVGFEFDPMRNRFDHHQRDKPLREETFEGNPIPYSSVGLVWRFFGEEYLLGNFTDVEPHLDRVWLEVDRTLMVPTDMTDNGIGASFAPTTLAVTVEDFNAPWDEPEDDGNERFLMASAFVSQVLEQRVIKAMAAARALDLATAAIENSADPQVVVLDQPLPWEPAIYAGGFDEVLYVVSERKGTWYCQAVRPEEGSFEQRKPLPSEWAGLRDEELAAVSGVPDAVFCHAMRFVCGAKSREGAIQMARLAVGHEPSPGIR